MKEQKSFKTILPDEGKKLLINDSLHDKIIVALNSRPQIREIEVPSYLGTSSTLDEIKETMIKQSKLNLAAFLEQNPLLSKAKYEEGRYYNVTLEKQQLLTSKVLMAIMYDAKSVPYNLTWNDTTEVCESWELSQLQQLSAEIDAYVTPLVSLQQTLEVKIRNTETIEDVLKIDIDFSIEKAMNNHK